LVDIDPMLNRHHHSPSRMNLFLGLLFWYACELSGDAVSEISPTPLFSTCNLADAGLAPSAPMDACDVSSERLAHIHHPRTSPQTIHSLQLIRFR
jgi:hypothetical protein